MLHGILAILKIIGILLAVILGIIVLLLLIILFVPIRYKIEGEKYGPLKKKETQDLKIEPDWNSKIEPDRNLETKNSCYAKAKVTWILHIISVIVEFQNQELSAKLKVFGFTVKDLMGEDTETENAALDAVKEGPEREAGQGSESKKESKKERKKGSVEKTEDSENHAASEKNTPPKKKNVVAVLFEKLKKLKYTIKRFYDKIKQGINKGRDFKSFLTDERTREAVGLCKKQIFYLLKKLFPKKIRGSLYFGTGEPDSTGQILGGIAIFYPVIKDQVRVFPDFQNQKIEGELQMKGHLRIVTLVLIALKLWRDKNIRYVYRKFR